MATVDEEDVPPTPVSVADMLGNVWHEVLEVPDRAAGVAYGGPSRSLWPLLLLSGVMTGLMVPKPVARLVGALSTTALAVWLASREVKR